MKGIVPPPVEMVVARAMRAIAFTRKASRAQPGPSCVSDSARPAPGRCWDVTLIRANRSRGRPGPDDRSGPRGIGRRVEKRWRGECGRPRATRLLLRRGEPRPPAGARQLRPWQRHGGRRRRRGPRRSPKRLRPRRHRRDASDSQRGRADDRPRSDVEARRMPSSAPQVLARWRPLSNSRRLAGDRIWVGPVARERRVGWRRMGADISRTLARLRPPESRSGSSARDRASVAGPADP
jgi:hypothetical protein